MTKEDGQLLYERATEILYSEFKMAIHSECIENPMVYALEQTRKQFENDWNSRILPK